MSKYNPPLVTVDKVTPESRAMIEKVRLDIIKNGLTPEDLADPMARLMESLKDPVALKEARHIEKVRSLEFLTRLQRFVADRPERIIEHRLVKEYSDEELEERIKKMQDKMTIVGETIAIKGPTDDDTIQ